MTDFRCACFHIIPFPPIINRITLFGSFLEKIEFQYHNYIWKLFKPDRAGSYSNLMLNEWPYCMMKIRWTYSYSRMEIPSITVCTCQWRTRFHMNFRKFGQFWMDMTLKNEHCIYLWTYKVILFSLIRMKWNVSTTNRLFSTLILLLLIFFFAQEPIMWSKLEI